MAVAISIANAEGHLLAVERTDDAGFGTPMTAQCKDAKDVNGDRRCDAFVTLNSTDPALVEAREILDIPALGFLETTALMSCMMGKTFSLITPNPKFALSLEQKLKLYGLTERLTSIEAMNIPTLAGFRQGFIDPVAHQRVMTEFDQAARRAIAKGAEVLIPCGSHAVLQARRGLREIDGALIVDGPAMLMKMTEAAVKLQQIMGTVVSRKMLYQMPGPEVREKAKQDYGIGL